MATAADISQTMKTALALSEPGLDTSIGSVLGKILDAASQSMSLAFLDQHLTRYQYDIDSMTAGALEGFVRLFGMNRRTARYASGTVTFGRAASTAATNVAVIPVGTQVMASTSPVITVQTTAGVVMALGQTTVDAPVRATVPGSAGNIAAGTLNTLASNVDAISTTTTNIGALTGGLDAEGDDDLRNRWKATVFRNLAGTEQMYRAMALQASDSVTAVNVIGARKTWSDRVTVAAGTSGPIAFGNPQFIYTSAVFVGPDLGSSKLLAQKTDYTVVINNTAVPATLTVNAISGGAMGDGDYDVQYDYVPTFSRNNPYGTRFNETAYVNNRVDVWVTGSDPVPVTQAGKFSSTVRFSALATDALYTGLFVTPDGRVPAANDVFTPLAYSPIVSIPASMTIGATTFTRGTHYDVVARRDAFGYGPASVCGIVWYAAGTIPVANAAFTIDYVYNQVPAEIQTLIQSQWRLLGTDAMIHAGIAQAYRFHFAVVYRRGSDTPSVNTAISAAVANIVGSLGFDSSLQISDVLQAVHNVFGVDNVRFLNSTDDATHYAIEKISTTGVAAGVVASGGRATDIYFDDASYPRYQDCRFLTRTRTSFGTS